MDRSLSRRTGIIRDRAKTTSVRLTEQESTPDREVISAHSLMLEQERVPMNKTMVIQSQLLATKFFIPVASHPLISRPRLTALLDEALKYPLILIFPPAGFGKTM